jgi:hypothetical protein
VTIDRPNVHQWDVSDHGGSVTVPCTGIMPMGRTWASIGPMGI